MVFMVPTCASLLLSLLILRRIRRILQRRRALSFVVRSSSGVGASGGGERALGSNGCCGSGEQKTLAVRRETADIRPAFVAAVLSLFNFLLCALFSQY